MALAYRGASFVSAGNAAGGDLAINKPTGTIDGDIVLLLCYFEPDTCAITISTSGWETAEVANTGAHKIKAFWKQALSEPATYTLSNDVAGDQWRSAVAVAYSGGTGAGTLLDVPAGTAQADSAVETLQTAPSVTTGGTNRLLAYVAGNIQGAAPTGMNGSGAATSFRGQLGGTVIGDGDRPSAGPTGTSNATGTGTVDYAAMHIALISDRPSGASVVISGASQTWPFPHPPFRVA